MRNTRIPRVQAPLQIEEFLMTHSLSGKTVAVLATSGFEQSELQEPKR